MKELRLDYLRIESAIMHFILGYMMAKGKMEELENTVFHFYNENPIYWVVPIEKVKELIETAKS